MSSTCFCGCGREINGVRPRANNAVASQMSNDLAVLRGALEKGEAGDRADEVTVLIAEGADHLALITKYLHDEIKRSALDKGAIKAWLDKADKMCDALVESSSGPPWEPDDPSTAHLAQSGTRANGVVTDVSRDGLGNERVASLRMSASIRPDGGAALAVTRTLSIAVVKAPRVGDRVEVSYYPADPNRFVYRPLIEAPPDDRISRLRELGDLLDEGLLTREEFEAEKARLLDN